MCMTLMKFDNRFQDKANPRDHITWLSFVRMLPFYSSFMNKFSSIKIHVCMHECILKRQAKVSLVNCSLELSFSSMGHFIMSSSPMIFHWLSCIQYKKFLSTCGACLEILWRFKQRTIYTGSLSAKPILGPPTKMNLTLRASLHYGPWSWTRAL